MNLVFECRLDTTNDLAWEDCEYPHEILNLSPGEHTLEVRAIDLNLIADDTPAKYTWVYEPLPGERSAGDVHRHRAARRDVGPGRAVHVPLERAGRDLRVQGRPVGMGELRLRDRRAHEPGRLRVGPRRDRGRPAHVLRPRDRLRGQRRHARHYDWRLLGIVTSFTDGPGFTPGTEGEPRHGRRGPELDGDDRVRVQRRRRHLRVLARPRAVRAVHLAGHLHRPDAGRPHAAGRRDRRRTASPSSRPPSTSGRSSSRSTTPRPRPTLDRAPADGSSSTLFEFSAHRRPDAARR